MKNKFLFLGILLFFSLFFISLVCAGIWKVHDPGCGDGVIQKSNPYNERCDYADVYDYSTNPPTLVTSKEELFFANSCNAPTTSMQCWPYFCRFLNSNHEDKSIGAPLTEDERKEFVYPIQERSSDFAWTLDTPGLPVIISIGEGNDVSRDIICSVVNDRCEFLGRAIQGKYGESASFPVGGGDFGSFDPLDEENNTYVLDFSLYENDVQVGSTQSFEWYFENSLPSATFNDKLTKDRGVLQCRVGVTKLADSSLIGNFSGAWLSDIDGDSYNSFKQDYDSTKKYVNPWSVQGDIWIDLITAGGDCDDWPYDDADYYDVNGQVIFKCVDDSSASQGEIFNELTTKRATCSGDSNNDGIGDYANCSYCRSPGMAEDADDIDNNCGGSCQGDNNKVIQHTRTYDQSGNLQTAPFLTFNSTLNIPHTCTVSGFVGDGAINDSIGEKVTGDSWEASGVYHVIVSQDSLGCGGTDTTWGQLSSVRDNFCQMVDENVVYKDGNGHDAVCNGYNRSVKWAESDPQYYVGGFDKYVFYPGGVNGNAENGKQAWSQPLSNSIPYIVSETSYLGNNEYIGSVKNSSGLPREFIDSFRGELDFKSFWNNVPANVKTSLQWKTSCVPKNKCDDGVSNDLDEDIAATEPYKFYFAQYSQGLQGMNIDFNDPTGWSRFFYNFAADFAKAKKIGVNVYVQPEQFKVPLIDVDDPQCKFSKSIPPYVTSSSTNPFPTYNWPSDYRINPQKNYQYCYDRDGDGFCGCPQLSVIGTIDTAIPTTTCNPTIPLNKRYSIPKQFPDCDDSPSIIPYEDSNGNNIFTKADDGWPDIIGFGTNFVSSKYVHPFAPVNKNTCYNQRYDFNCNKDYDSGYDLNSLKYGGTLFDFDLSTGVEKKNLFRGNFYLYGGGSSGLDLDLVCYEPYPLEKDIQSDLGLDLTIVTTKLLLALNPYSALALTFHSGYSAFMDSVRLVENDFVNPSGGKINWANLPLDVSIIAYKWTGPLSKVSFIGGEKWLNSALYKDIWQYSNVRNFAEAFIKGAYRYGVYDRLTDSLGSATAQVMDVEAIPKITYVGFTGYNANSNIISMSFPEGNTQGKGIKLVYTSTEDFDSSTNNIQAEINSKNDYQMTITPGMFDKNGEPGAVDLGINPYSTNTIYTTYIEKK